MPDDRYGCSYPGGWRVGSLTVAVPLVVISLAVMSPWLTGPLTTDFIGSPTRTHVFPPAGVSAPNLFAQHTFLYGFQLIPVTAASSSARSRAGILGRGMVQ